MSQRPSNPGKVPEDTPWPGILFAIHPEIPSETGTASYSVVTVRRSVIREASGGLGPAEIQDLAGREKDAVFVVYGPDPAMSEELWRIATGVDSLLLDVRLLARILLPGLKDYEQGTVAECLDLANGLERDSSTAQTTAGVCLALLDLMAGLDPDTLSALTRLAEGTGTGLDQVFALLERRKAAAAAAARPGKERPWTSPLEGGMHTIGEGVCDPGEKAGDLDLLDSDEVAGLFATGGRFERRMDGYEQRPQQLSMVRGVVRAFNEGEVLVVEAGTGTGKSLSYLTPALIWAVRNDQRVIISTNTRNLQEQLFYKDLPFLLDNLGIPFRATLLKGRSNYLCLDRWRQVIRRPADQLTPDEREAAIPLVIWARDTQTGDLSEHAGFNRAEGRGLWEKINGEGTACPRCVLKEACFVNRVRKAANTSHMVIVNHALLFSDLQSDHAVLSRYDHLVIDEAHNLERAAVQHLTLEIGGWRMRNVLGRMYTPDRGGIGVLPALARLASQAAENQEWKSPLAAGARMAVDRLTEVNRRIEEFFRTATDEALVRSEDRSSRWTKLRYRRNDEYAGILGTSAPDLMGSLANLRETLGILHGTLDYVPDSWMDDRETRMNAVLAATDFCREMEEALYSLTRAEEEETVYWIDASKDHPMSSVLTAAPLRVADRLHDDLFRALRTVVLTSATLTVGNRFDYQVERLGLDRLDPQRLQVQGIGSPFDYEDQVLVGVPAAFPSPRSDAFQSAISRFITDLVVSTMRSTLVLFTSYKQLNRTYEETEAELSEHGVVVMAQGRSGPRSAVLDRFRLSDTAVLLGTDSFWEGVDVPGKALEIVILVKMPFAVPTEPLVQAQVERLEEAGRNSFLEFQVPEAVIKFRQGFGRLIRSTRDYGVVTILDQRVISTAYGRLFLDSLPAKPEVFPDGDGLVEGVTYWFRARDRRRTGGRAAMTRADRMNRTRANRI